MNQYPLNIDYLTAIYQLNDVIRRAVDGTVPPLFVDYQNQRVLIGSTTASGSNNFQIFKGNVQIVTTGDGIVFPDGTKQTTSATSSFMETQAVVSANFTSSPTTILNYTGAGIVNSISALDTNGASEIVTLILTIDGGTPVTITGPSMNATQVVALGPGLQFLDTTFADLNASQTLIQIYFQTSIKIQMNMSVGGHAGTGYVTYAHT